MSITIDDSKEKNMTVLEVLKKARALIASPENWTTKTSAQLSDGSYTHAFDESATRFCSVGALQNVVGRLYWSHNLYYGACEALARAWGSDALGENAHCISFERNDSSTHEEVLEAFDVAILNVELEQGLSAPVEMSEESLVAV